jgi:hypothetical protein
MNTLKTVYEKLFKEETTNLASHEVELASIKDLQDTFKKGQAAIESANSISYSLGDAVTLWNKTFSKLKTELFLVEKNIKDGYQLIFEIEKQAKELGINEVPEVTKIKGYLGGFEKTLTALRGAVNDSKNRINTDFK